MILHKLVAINAKNLEKQKRKNFPPESKKSLILMCFYHFCKFYLNPFQKRGEENKIFLFFKRKKMVSLLENTWCAALKTQIQLKTGCFLKEKKAAQKVGVEVKVWANVKKIQPPFILGKILNYDSIFNALKNLESAPHTDFLEESALHLAKVLFRQHPLVEVFWVKMEKIEIYQGSATPSIELFLTRKEWENLN